MEMFAVAVVSGLLVGLVVRANYRGHLDDLQRALARERRMRESEEQRAETLSDALFGKTRIRVNSDKLRN
jgi:hypothetical protein